MFVREYLKEPNITDVRYSGLQRSISVPMRSATTHALPQHRSPAVAQGMELISLPDVETVRHHGSVAPFLLASTAEAGVARVRPGSLKYRGTL
jgi:hypothetical protein